MFDTHAQYFHDEVTDRLHPNAKGHYRMAKAIMYQLLVYPADLNKGHTAYNTDGLMQTAFFVKHTA